MNSRIKLIRENENLTQDAFGKRIGSARNTIANYENGNRTPSNAVVTSICKEYGVNEMWLRSGEGEMYSPTHRETEIAKLTVDLLTEEPDSFALTSSWWYGIRRRKKSSADIAICLVMRWNTTNTASRYWLQLICSTSRKSS